MKTFRCLSDLNEMIFDRTKLYFLRTLTSELNFEHLMYLLVNTKSYHLVVDTFVVLRAVAVHKGICNVNHRIIDS
jgi:hypothetical protein